MLFQQHIWCTITCTTVYSLGVICKVDHSILNPLKIRGFTIFFVEHPILPSSSASSTQTSWTFVCFKLTSVMSILDKELHMLWDMTMDDDRCIIFNIKLQIIEILYWITQFFYSLLNSSFHIIMFFFRFIVHMKHCIHLKMCHSCFFIKNKCFCCIFSTLNQMSCGLMRHYLLSTMNTFL